MQRLQPEMVEASQHDAVNGVALTVRNSHLINPRLPLHGRAAHAWRERYLAKEWFGSNRVGQERLQLPVATTTETNLKKKCQQQLHAIHVTNDPRETGGCAARYHYAPTQGQTRKKSF
jgi:hypothetical protein